MDTKTCFSYNNFSTVKTINILECFKIQHT